MIVVPIGSYFVTVDNLFKGNYRLGAFSIQSWSRPSFSRPTLPLISYQWVTVLTHIHLYRKLNLRRGPSRHNGKHGPDRLHHRSHGGGPVRHPGPRERWRKRKEEGSLINLRFGLQCSLFLTIITYLGIAYLYECSVSHSHLRMLQYPTVYGSYLCLWKLGLKLKWILGASPGCQHAISCTVMMLRYEGQQIKWLPFLLMVDLIYSCTGKEYVFRTVADHSNYHYHP